MPTTLTTPCVAPPDTGAGVGKSFTAQKIVEHLYHMFKTSHALAIVAYTGAAAIGESARLHP